MKKRRMMMAAGLVIVWMSVSLLADNPVLFPSPVEVFMTMLKQLESPSFFVTVFSTVERMLKGLLLSTVLGLILGVLGGLNTKFEAYFSLVEDVIKTIPNASYIVLALVWLGSENSIMLICFFILFPNIYSEILLGVKSLPQDQKNIMAVFPAPLSTLIFKVYVPQLLPYFISALKVAFGMGFKVCVMAEIMGAVKNGIGREIAVARTYVEISEILGWTIWIILLSLAVETIFDLLLKISGYEKI